MRTTWLYDDPEHPDRVTGTVASPEWTEDDRAAMLGLRAYEATLCPGCGEPKKLAWHSHTEGEWEAQRLVCHACTASAGEEQVYTLRSLFMSDQRLAAMPPFDLEKTTTEPEKKPDETPGR